MDMAHKNPVTVAEYLYNSLILNSIFKLTNHFILIDLREPWEELIGCYSHFIMRG